MACRCHPAEVCTAHRAGIRMRSSRHRIDKRLARVIGGKEVVEIDIGSGQARIERGLDPADHRDQMGNEGQIQGGTGEALEVLSDLGRMPVSTDRVGLEAFADLGHQQTRRRLAPGTADAGLRIRNQPARIDDSGGEQRNEPERHCSRIATRIRHQSRAAHGIAIELRQPVDRLGKKLRTGMRHAVPGFPKCGIFQPKVGSQIDDAHAAREQVRHRLHGRSVGRGEIDEVAFSQRTLVGRRELKIQPSPQMRKHLGHRNPCLGAGGDDHNRRGRMPRQDPQEFRTRITRAADDSDPHHTDPTPNVRKAECDPLSPQLKKRHKPLLVSRRRRASGIRNNRRPKPTRIRKTRSLRHRRPAEGC